MDDLLELVRFLAIKSFEESNKQSQFICIYPALALSEEAYISFANFVSAPEPKIGPLGWQRETRKSYWNCHYKLKDKIGFTYN
jgi:hypothetical protein